MRTIRLFGHYVPSVMAYIAALEFPVLVLTFYLGIHLRFVEAPNSMDELQPLLPKAVLYAGVVMISMAALRLYETLASESRRELILRIATGMLISVIPLSFLYYIAPGLSVGRGAFAFALLLSLLGAIGLRYIFFRFIHHNLLLRRMLVIGSGDGAAEIREYDRQHHRRKGFVIVGYVHLPHEKTAISDDLPRFSPKDLKHIVQKRGVSEIVIAVDDRRKSLPVDDILACKLLGVEVFDLSTFFERQTRQIRLRHLHPSWLFYAPGFDQSWFRDVRKFALDILVVALLLPLALPMMALASIAILLENGPRQPLFFTQDRVGRGGKIYRIYKFRSMRPDEEGDRIARWAQKNDPRATRVGRILRKFRIDELPQLVNVLQGNMTLVGPRPEQPDFVEELRSTIPYYNERHLVKPGLTGLAQISYQYGSTEEDAREKLQYDLYYVKNHSALLDILILLKTAEVMFVGKGGV